MSLGNVAKDPGFIKLSKVYRRRALKLWRTLWLREKSMAKRRKSIREKKRRFLDVLCRCVLLAVVVEVNACIHMRCERNKKWDPSGSHHVDCWCWWILKKTLTSSSSTFFMYVLNMFGSWIKISPMLNIQFVRALYANRIVSQNCVIHKQKNTRTE